MRPGHAPTRERRATDCEVIDRLTRLRTILPLMATDLAAARRRAHALEADNRRLARRVFELEAKLACTQAHARHTPPETSDAVFRPPAALGLPVPRG
jgi:hypothetical protein